MQKLVFRNPNGEEIDFTNGDFGVTRWEGFSKVDMEVQSQQVPFHDGSVFLDALLAERELSITVAVNDENDLEKRYRLKRQLIHCLNPKLGEGELIYTNDYTSKKIVCVPAIPEFENKNMNDRGTLKASCSFTASSPYWEDVEETEVYFDALNQVTVENKGDVPCNIKADIIGLGATNLSIVNATTNQKIKYQDSVEYGLRINTNTGNKSVEKEIFSTKLYYGGNITSFAENENEIVAVGDVLRRSINGENWDFLSYSNIGNIFQKIIFIKEKGLFYACGDLELLDEPTRIATSDNGKDWRIVYDERGRFSDICFSFGLNKFCAVGLVSIGISSDGEHWTWQNPSYERYKAVACNDSYFVAVGSISNNYLIKYSDDGEIWNQITVDITGAFSFHSIANKPGTDIFVAVGDNGRIFVSNSSIPSTFIEVASPTTNALKGITFDEMSGTFLIVGDNGTLLKYDYDNSIIEQLSVNTTNNLNFIKYSYITGKYFIVGDAGTIISSYDLHEWNKQILFNDFILSNIIKVGENYFGSSGNKIYKSPDGENWNSIFELPVEPNPSHRIDLFKYVEEKKVFILCADFGFIGISNDAENWTYSYDTFDTSVYYDVAYSSKLNLFVLSGRYGNVKTSVDGMTWNKINIGTGNDRLTKIIWSKEKEIFITVGYPGIIFTSTDGSTWTERNNEYSGYLVEFKNVVYYPQIDLFCITFQGKKFLESQDGINWSSVGFNQYNITLVYYNEIIQKLCCFCETQELYMSSDGINWDDPIIYGELGRNSKSITFIKYNPDLKLFIAPSEYKIYLSFDGINWGLQNFDKGIKWEQVFNLNNGFYVIGDKNSAGIYFLEPNENAIDKITDDSDMNFYLDVGNNLIRYLENNRKGKVILKYTQKYLGV